MVLRRTLLIALLAVVTTGLHAQLTLKGEVRTRSWLDHGALGLSSNGAADPGVFTAQRSRLYADYKMDQLDFHLSLQDVRAWGNTPQLYQGGTAQNDDNSIFNVFQAWGKYNFSESSSLKIGRQVISYDDQRYLGGLGWLEQGRVHDAFTYAVKMGNTTLTLPFAHGPQGELSGAYLGNDAYKYAFFPHLNQKFTGGDVSLLLAPIVKPGGYTKLTMGLTGKTSLSETSKLGGSLYYQAGTATSGQTHAGLEASLYASLKPSAKVGLTIGAEYLSGDDDATDDKVSGFSPDFGTNHKFNGFMDHFYVGAAPEAGLIDFHVKSSIKTGEKTKLLAHAHYFMTAVDPSKTSFGTDDSGYGAEIDLVYVVPMGSSTSVKFGYSQFFAATETMEAYRGGDADAFHGWAWMMFSFNPTLYKTPTAELPAM